MFAASDLSHAARNLAAAAIHRAWRWIGAVGCVGPEDALGRRYRHMGANSCIAFPPGSVFGERAIEIGTETLIGPYVSLAAGMPLETGAIGVGDRAVIVIGDRCSIGRGTSIVGLRDIHIGDDVAIGPNGYITDHNHRYDDVSVPIAGQWPAEGSVRIGSGSWLGAGVIVLPGSEIGAHVTVAAGSVVRGPVPDRSVVAGVPARLVRRYTEETGWIPPLRQLTTTTNDDPEAALTNQANSSPETLLTDQVRRALTSGHLAHLVTLGQRGDPQVTLVWVGIENNEIVAAHLGAWQKVKNIRRDARVVLSLETGEPNEHGLDEYLVVYGRARVTEGGAADLLQKLAWVYIGPDVKFPPMDNPPPGYVTRITPERVAGVGPWNN